MNHWSYYVPNTLTIMRIALTPLFVRLLFGDEYSIILAMFIFILASISDFYDGYLARRLGICSKFGGFLDPLADKIFVLGALSAFATLNLLPWWVVVVVTARDMAITLLRLIMVHAGYRFVTSRFGKWKTTIQLLTIYYILCGMLVQSVWHSSFILIHVSWVVHIMVMLTIVSGFSYILSNWRSLRRIIIMKQVEEQKHVQ